MKHKKKKEEECWLFLDCKEMTGFPQGKCPNFKACKENALHSENRYCNLPYQRYLPQFDQLFTHPVTYVSFNLDEPTAKEAGYISPSKLFYEYKDNNLLIGKEFDSPYHLSIPKEAEELGFARAEEIPFALNPKPGLYVTQCHHLDDYPRKFIDAGWYPAIDLPFFNNIGKMIVCFDTDDPAYLEAINRGWYPAIDT